MHKLISFSAASVLLLSAATPAAAQTSINKTWVSGLGNDSGTCPITAPCRTFAYALSITNAGGEIDVRDSGNYGEMTITKAISVVSEGTLASVGAPVGSNGITINAGANDNVLLRGLTIDGHGGGQDGILFNSGKSLTVQDCQVRNFVNTGIGAVVQTTSQIHISDSTVANSTNGIVIQPSSSGFITVSVSIERVQALSDSNFGIYIDGANARSALTAYDLIATIDDSLVSDSGDEGLRVESKETAMFTNVSLSNSRMVRNGLGVSAVNTNATLFVSRSLFVGNSTNYSANGGSLISQGNNTVFQSGAGASPNFPNVVSETY